MAKSITARTQAKKTRKHSSRREHVRAHLAAVWVNLIGWQVCDICKGTSVDRQHLSTVQTPEVVITEV